LVDSNDNAELEKRMLKRIAFGTAGLRGQMKAGFSGMNDLTVVQASQVGPVIKSNQKFHLRVGFMCLHHGGLH
jgi:phosphomannomutase